MSRTNDFAIHEKKASRRKSILKKNMAKMFEFITHALEMKSRNEKNVSALRMCLKTSSS